MAKVSLALLTSYEARGHRFFVTKDDAVYDSDGKVVGYNHARAWQKAMLFAVDGCECNVGLRTPLNCWDCSANEWRGAQTGRMSCSVPH